MNWLWALGAIVLIAVIYEVNQKVGLGLALVAVMAMALTYARKNPISFERSV